MSYRTKKSLHTVKLTKALTLKRPIEKDRRYSTKNWREHSITLRAQNPMCAICNNIYPLNKLVVDHIIPISENGSFWHPDNHQVLCDTCHNSKTMSERAGSKTPYVLNEDNEKIPKDKVIFKANTDATSKATTKANNVPHDA